MSSDQAAAMDVVLDTNALIQQFPMEWGEMQEAIGDWGIMDEYVFVIQEEDGIDDSNDVYMFYQAWRKLKQAFWDTYGVHLYMDVHNSGEDGGPYDDIDGVFFCVQMKDVYEHKPKGYTLYKQIPFQPALYIVTD